MTYQELCKLDSNAAQEAYEEWYEQEAEKYQEGGEYVHYDENDQSYIAQ